jgi:hypothetical protein
MNIDIKAKPGLCRFCVHRPWSEDPQPDFIETCPKYLEIAKDEVKRDHDWKGEDGVHNNFAYEEREPAYTCGNFIRYKKKTVNARFRNPLWIKLTNATKDKEVLSMCEALVGGVVTPDDMDKRDIWPLVREIKHIIETWGWKDTMITEIRDDKPGFGTILSKLAWLWSAKPKTMDERANDYLPSDLHDTDRGRLLPETMEELLNDFKINELANAEEIKMLTEHFNINL